MCVHGRGRSRVRPSEQVPTRYLIAELELGDGPHGVGKVLWANDL